jgi:hypothetical protein
MENFRILWNGDFKINFRCFVGPIEWKPDYFQDLSTLTDRPSDRRLSAKLVPTFAD